MPTVSNFDELKAAVESSAATVTFAADIDMGDATLRLPTDATMKFDMQGHKLTANHVGAATHYVVLSVPKDAHLTISKGTIELNAPGDPSFRYYTNTINVDGALSLINCTVINNCTAGICSCIDTVSSGGTVVMEGGAIRSKRYGVRIWCASETKQSSFTGRGVSVETTSTGLYLQNPSSKPTLLGLIQCEGCSITSGRSSVYLEDDSSTPHTGTGLQARLTDCTVVSGLPSGSDKWYEGAEGWVTYDGSTLNGDANMLVVISTTPPPRKVPPKGARNKARPKAMYPRFAAGIT